MRQAHAELERELALELLQRIQAAPPSLFEQLVVRLLVKMGYGGSVGASDGALVLGRSGDGGVDGVIDQDALGLDRVYVQAKRYAEGNVVGPGAIRDFFGALDGFRAAKGLFFTTSAFSAAAVQTANTLSKRIVLIDGQRLVRLMVQHNVGCRIEDTLHIKEIDEEVFE
jgi:restriction system protein